MIKNIEYVIGIIVTLFAFGIAIYIIPQSLFSSNTPEEINIQTQIIPPDVLLITWSTETPQKGYVSYIDSVSREGREHEPDYTMTHRIQIDLDGLVVPITYHIESCPVKGICIAGGSYTYP